MQTLWQDLRYGARMLLKNPGFTLIAVVTMALGIGANTEIFSVVNAVLLRPLPYQEPSRLVAVWETNLTKPGSKGSMSYPNFFDLRAQSSSFDRVASYYTNDVALTGLAAPVNVRSAVISAEMFDLLGAKPLLGRSFVPEEDHPDSSTGRAVMISHSLWQRQFSSDPEVVGRSIMVNSKPFNLVGVMPAGFQFPIEADRVELWLTSAIDAEKVDPKDKPGTEQRGAHYIAGVARLKPGVTIEQAQADVDVIGANLEKQYPDTNTKHSFSLISYHDDLVADYESALWIILGAVGCVLLIACANVANLLLARSTARRKEIAVRAALGADRKRIVRQLLTESLLLSLVGGALGLALASLGGQLLIGTIPEDVPRLSEISLDRWVFGFTLLVSVVTGVVFGLAPAVSAAKVELTEAIKEGGRTSGGGVRSRLRSTLVVAEIAIAMVLLVGAGLLLKTFEKLQRVDLGYDTHHVLTASVDIPESRYPKPGQVAQFYSALLAKVKTLPGVVSASAIVPQPLSGDTFVISFEIEGRNIPKGEQPVSHFRSVAAGYFETMKIPILAGRAFTDNDDEKSLPVIIVNEAFAEKHFPGEDPIGKHLKPGISVDNSETKWREIVGVVKNVKHRQSLSRDYDPEYYVPHLQMPISSMNLVIRTANEPVGLAGIIQKQVNELDKEVPAYRIKTFDQYLGIAVAQPRFNATLLGLFAGLALLLTAIGLYGVMAYSVVQRTQEIGVRIALGAQSVDVMKMILRQGMTLTAAGLALGAVAAFALTRLMSSLLFGVAPTDPATFAVIAALVAGVALLACYVPARRATRADPITALRYE